MNDNKIAPIHNFSAAGEAKLESMAGNVFLYEEFLRYQGRIFKQPVSVGLEFYTQRPNARFIGTENQWKAAKYSIAQGETAIRFIDDKGVQFDYYDLSQTDQKRPPRIWTMDKAHSELVRKELELPGEGNLISHLVNRFMPDSRISECMRAMEIPISERAEFGKALKMAASSIIAGRFEVGGNKIQLRNSVEIFKSLDGSKAKLTFLTAAAQAARDALIVVENTIRNNIIRERNERNDLREMGNSDRGRTEERAGRGTAGDTRGAAAEQYSVGKDGSDERRNGLGVDTESRGSREQEVVSGVQIGAAGGTDDLVQVQSAERNVQHEPVGAGSVDGGRTDRNIRTEMDEMDGGELSSPGNGDEVLSQVSDNSQSRGQQSVGTQRTAGETVREAEPSTRGLRGSADMGADQSILHGQHSDEGNGPGTGNETVTEKVDIYSNPSTNSADGFVVDEDELSDQHELERISTEISDKKKSFIENIENMTADDIRAFSDELRELEKNETLLQDRLKEKPIHMGDVDKLRAITPKRKSVQNLLDTEVAQVPKFQKQQDEKMGAKSAFTMRQEGGNDWRNDDSLSVSVLEISKHDKPHKLTEIRKDKTIPRGTYVNKDTGSMIVFGKRSIDESVAKAIQDSRRGKEVDIRMDLLYNMQKITENAICFDTNISEIGASKTKNTLFMHQFYLPIKSGDDYYLAKLYVEETFVLDKDNQFDTSKRIYNVKDIKTTPIEANRVFSPTSAVTKSDNADTSIGANISISHLYNLVKAYDRAFYENVEAVGRKDRLDEIKNNQKVDTYINFPDEADLIGIDKLTRNGDVLYWNYFNEDGADGNGQMVELTISDHDIQEAAKAMEAAGGRTESGYQTFIDHIMQHSSQTTSDRGTDYFENEKNAFINGEYSIKVNTGSAAERARQLVDFMHPITVIPVRSVGYEIDLKGIDRYIIEYDSDVYLGGIDENGHERKDNFDEEHVHIEIGLTYDGKIIFENNDGSCIVYDQNNASDMEKLDDSIGKHINHSKNLKTYTEKDGNRAEIAPPMHGYEKAINLINDFCVDEYGSEADTSSLNNISLAYTTTEDGEHEIQVEADLYDKAIRYQLDGEVYKEEQYNEIGDLIKNGLTGLNFDEMVAISDDELASILKKRGSSEEKVDTDINFSETELSFSEQIYNATHGLMNEYDALKVCDTPKILVDVGCSELPMLFTQKHLRDAMHEKSPRNSHYHGLTVDQLEKIPQNISDPAIILDSFSPNRAKNDTIVVVLPILDNDNAPIIVSIVPNGSGVYQLERVDANFITSIYGKDKSFDNYIKRAAENNQILYWNKQKSQDLFTSLRLQLPQALNNLDSNIIIHQSNNIVNTFDAKNVDENNKSQGTSSVLGLQSSEGFDNNEEKVDTNINFSDKKATDEREIIWSPVSDTADENGKVDVFSTKVNGTFFWIEPTEKGYDITMEHRDGSVRPVYSDFRSRTEAEDFFYEDYDNITAYIEQEFANEEKVDTYINFSRNKDHYRIYQLPAGEKYHGIRFTSKETLDKEGVQLSQDDYKMVYEGNWEDISGSSAEMKLQNIFAKFNIDHPEDFKGHSLSVSDVITVGNDSIETAYYVDSFGFKEMPEFFKKELELTEEIIDADPDVPEQLSMFGESEPITENDAATTEYSSAPVIDGVPVYEALAAEIDRGTGFVNGKIRVQEFYEKSRSQPNHPTTKELADCLKKEYGIGGHSGDGKISMVDYDSKGLTLSFKNGEKFRHSWYNVAVLTEARLRDNTYLSPEQQEEWQAMKTERGVEYEPYKIKIGDKFRNKATKTVYEVVSLSGALPFYTGDCVVKSTSGSVVITENKSYQDLIGNGLYEYITEDENLLENTATETKSVDERKTEVDTYINFSEKEEAVPAKRHRKTTAEKLYDKFTEMYPDIVSGEHDYERYGMPGDAYEPLTVEALGEDMYAFMTYYEQMGDIMRDPDFTLRLDHENKRVEMLEYQQDGVTGIGTVYQNVVDENGNVDEKLRAALEKNFMQNLNAAEQSDRELTRFKDGNGNVTELSILEEAKEEVQEIVYDDKTPELREVLNAFSQKHGLGELNVEAAERGHSYWSLKEKMKDGTEIRLNDIYNRDYDMPFTPETLERTLTEFEETQLRFGREISELGNREFSLRMHGGKSELPMVQKDLPEIKYADNPSQKIRDNISALREVIRLENAEMSGKALYDERGKYADTKENSEDRLRRFSGWGGLSQVFDERFPQQQRTRDQLHTMLTDAEYASASSSTLNAHFTPQTVIDAMYKVVKNMELPRNARILEPSCGSGNFITRLPGSFNDAQVVGVELDGMTAKIAKWLNHDNPNVRIIESAFERTPLENNSFDLAIGNVPFGDYQMNDPDYAKNWLIHDAFFRKALDKVAPGGVVAFITSSGTMDKGSPKVREYLATQADLVGAIRLPNNAFKDAGTPVTSDIIFLKKREVPLAAHEPKPDWCYTVPNDDGLKINSYFVDNPQMVLGKMEKTTHFDMLTCQPIEGADLELQLDEAIKNINAKITVTRREQAIREKRGNIEPWGKNFTYQIKDSKIYYRQGEDMAEVRCTPKDAAKLSALCELRDTTRELLDKQKTSVSDDALIPLRDKLNEQFDAYRAKYGALNDKKTAKQFGSDSDYPILQALEKNDGSKADVFYRRTVNPDTEIAAVENAEQALQISLDRKGKVDMIYMSMLLEDAYPEKSIEEIAETVCSELLDKELVFKDPEKQMPGEPYSGIVERTEYLSGNVRMKLTLAREYAKSDPLYENNAAALEKVMPEDIKAEEIAVQMGCPWIDAEDYTAFLTHLSGRSRFNARNSDVSYSAVTGEFSIMNAGSKKDLNVNETTTYGTADLNMYQLAEKLLNQRRIAVMKEVPSKKDPTKVVTRTDPRATKIAIEKAKKIKEEFKKWIFEDPARKEKYERRYNDIFNSLVGREYDGSKLSFPGIRNDFKLRPHQKNCVARAIYGGNTLAAHVVGAGKSAVMFSTVMKKKELGLINKACVVVPKPLTEQVANEWRKLYPDAKILTVTNDDLSNEKKRNLFTARVATGAYDAVIMSQEQYEKIPMSKEYRVQFMQKELDNLEDILRQKKSESRGKRDYSVKAIEKAKKQLQTKIEKLTDPKGASRAKDDLLEFEQLGFDYLVVDEAHAYKNGYVTTKMTNVAGVTTRPSGRAEDMQMKTDYFNTELGQGHILFCTGTPVSNSMTELYVMTRYLRPDLLEQAGVSRFDDWAATFGNVVTKNQQAADGTLKLRTSFASFANLPELMAIYKEFADVQSADKLDLPRPQLKTGKPQIIKIAATPEQKAYVKELAERAQQIANGNVEPYEDNLLKITGEARLIGLGNRAIEALYKKREEELPTDFVSTEESKVDKCIQKVSELYKQTDEQKGVQIIFSDIAVNSDNGNFSVYDYMKAELIKKGIPEDEIIFAPKSDSKEREAIFADINAGKYRVVIASTNTLGTGANIQQHLYALHHIDVPWKPSDFEQREGRILRQGNSFDEVEIYNYVTEGTLDSYLYQTVTDKARFIAQLLDDKCPARVSEDCDEKVLTFGEIQAAAEGNPDFKRRIELANEIAELTMLRNEYVHETAVTRLKAEKLPEQIEHKKKMLEKIHEDKQAAEKIKELRIEGADGSKLTEKKNINALLLRMAQKKLDTDVTDNTEISVNGFKVSAFNNGGDDVRFSIKGAAAYTIAAGTNEGQDNYQRLMNFFEHFSSNEEKITAEITAMETDLEQSIKRIEQPFDKEKELDDKQEELAKLERKLSKLSVQEDEILDPEEEPYVETKEENKERKEFYNSDDDDYQSMENGNGMTR